MGERPRHKGKPTPRWNIQLLRRPEANEACPARNMLVLAVVGDPVEVRCGLLKGHTGPHIVHMEWTDSGSGQGTGDKL